MLTLKNKIYLVTSVFFILCCCCQYYHKLSGVFTINLLADIIFFTIFLKFKKIKERTIPLFWLFFILAATAIYFNNNIAYGPITTSLKLIGYVMLLIYVYPKQKKVKNNSMDICVYSLVFLINVYVVYKIVELVADLVEEQYMTVVFFVYGIVLILLSISAYRYRLLHDSRSRYFLFLIAFLITAEVFGIVGFFLDYTFMYYLEYFFFLFGLSFGVIAFIDENVSDSVHKLIKTGSI
ncbi:hypothetical protein [Algibacter lectus]|uniref:Uncharacterized protein n=1 Tax=Algibacter lectus TaxID=221126 RepID=A0A090X5G0_9FLAO|nr:hypothetical protein [Algibacter lectus]MWW24976.1 hypothetical protein [Algibacter lectus]TDY64613.1 hypothetical protein DFQ06_1525 [Algibacter lectus]SFD20317.1 hypothetical protein SAMN04489722_10649 [Algibacter lectus]GAL61303.1 hypothetical protein JCM19300_4249 [Algibacter lectus]GAL79467.1 hypothetical protein JCM19274_1975 [Algibacter lectus]